MNQDICEKFKKEFCEKCTPKHKEKCEGFVQTINGKIRCISRDIIE